MHAQDQFVESVKRELGRRLSSGGFDATPVVETLDRFKILYWVRRKNWKSDAVKVYSYKSSADSLSVALEVYLPIQDDEVGLGTTSVGTVLHSVDIGAVINRGKPYYYPRFFDRFLVSRADSYARKLARDVEKSIRWFEDYSDPQECLRKLEAGETNWGDNRGKAYLALKRHMEKARDSIRGEGEA